MALLVILMLLATACGFSLLRWRWTGRVILLVAVVLFLGIGCGPIPSYLLRNLQSGYSDEVAIREAPRSAIILAIHEYIGYWRYFVYEWMGWNVTASRPGSL